MGLYSHRSYLFRVRLHSNAKLKEGIGGKGEPGKGDMTPEQMSESYHEIFDTLMPPETAKAKVLAAETASETDTTDDVEEAVNSLHITKDASSPSR